MVLQVVCVCVNVAPSVTNSHIYGQSYKKKAEVTLKNIFYESQMLSNSTV